MVGVAFAGPSDGVWVVEEIALETVGVAVADGNELFEFVDFGEGDGVVVSVGASVGVFYAVECGVEYAGDALFAEEDEGVGEWFEPEVDG